MGNVSRIDRVSVSRLRRIRDNLEDDDIPVTLTRLSRRAGVPVSTMWHMTNRYAPWLKDDLRLVKGRRDDDDTKLHAYWAAIARLRKMHGCWSYALVAKELEIKVGTVKEYMRTRPRLKGAKGRVPNWEANYRIAAATIAIDERTSASLAAALKSLFGFGSENHVRAFLRRNPAMIGILSISGYTPREKR